MKIEFDLGENENKGQGLLAQCLFQHIIDLTREVSRLNQKLDIMTSVVVEVRDELRKKKESVH